jgi:glycosyltransferase involved in cell wall biosynthesis
MALLLHHATLAVGVTAGCLEGLLEDGMPPGRTKTIYNGVDPDGWARGDETQLRARLGIAPSDVVLARVGSLIHRKGVDVMLRVFQRLLADRPHCRLLVVGEGPDREQLEAMACDLGVSARVHFLGFVPSSGAVLRDATDIVISPARVEGFGSR